MVIPTAAVAQANDLGRNMNQPVPPFHIIGNIYYVGASDITSYLIVTPAGDILLDGGFVETAPQIEANIQKLGFKLKDVKFILNSHAHLDHAGGISEMKHATGANDTVTVGAVTMTAHLTPGHTRGCTTWTTVARDGVKRYNVVFVGSATVLPNYKLIDLPNAPATYPGIQADYEKTFRVLRSLPCDVFLASHGSFYSLVDKRSVMSKNSAQNPFIDPWGYQAYILRAEAAFQKELQNEQSPAK